MARFSTRSSAIALALAAAFALSLGAADTQAQVAPGDTRLATGSGTSGTGGTGGAGGTTTSGSTWLSSGGGTSGSGGSGGSGGDRPITSGVGGSGGSTSGGSSGYLPPGPPDFAIAPIFDTWEFVDALHPIKYPCDMPVRGVLPLYECNIEQAGKVNDALDMASYMVWRVRQVLSKIDEVEGEEAKTKLWDTYFVFGSYNVKAATLKTWFGPYNSGRFTEIKWAYRDIWEKYFGPGDHSEFRISCDCGVYAMSAHHFNAKGPEVCPQFFYDYSKTIDRNIRNRAQTLVHESLHRTWVHNFYTDTDELIHDIHTDCTIDDGDDGAEKCYSDTECVDLAEHHPDEAYSNNSNYEYYSRRLVDLYNAGDCTNPNFCSPRDTTAPGCRGVVDQPPSYPDCPDPRDPNNFGTDGCPCADIDIVQAEDAANDGGFPDGQGSFLGTERPAGQFCHGASSVCDKVIKDGKAYPICRSCDSKAEIGCPCSSQNDCDSGDGLTCWGSSESGFASAGTGTCLPSAPAKLEELPWFCLDNCAAISSYQENGAACVYRQVPGFEFSHGTCVNFATSCGEDLPGQCEQQGKICRVDAKNNDVCVAECKTAADCKAHGFPEEYECDAEGKLGYTPGHCVPAGCGSDASEYCNLFRLALTAPSRRHSPPGGRGHPARCWTAPPPGVCSGPCFSTDKPSEPHALSFRFPCSAAARAGRPGRGAGGLRRAHRLQADDHDRRELR